MSNLYLVSRRHVSERLTLDVMRRRYEAQADADPLGFLMGMVRRHDLEIQSPDAKYAARDELMLIRWLAEAQRQYGLQTFELDDVMFEACLYDAARDLESRGIRIAALCMAGPVMAGAGRAPSAAGALRGDVWTSEPDKAESR